MKSVKVISIFMLTLVLSACSTKSVNSPQPQIAKQQINIPINDSLFIQTKTTQLNEQAIFSLTLEQQNKFLLKFNKHIALGFKPHTALYEILKEKITDFTYYGETYNATTVMELNKGNCMSLAILTTAYAKLVGLEFSYRVVHTLPIFSKKDDVVLSSSHVQTIIYDPTFVPDKSFFYLSTPRIAIDYFPNKWNRKGKSYSYNAFIAMYYKNLAADALVEKDLSKSFIYANKAYEYDTKNIDTINLLAVIHRRAGDIKTAEEIYKVALDIGKPNISLLSNYIMLLKSQQRMEEVAVLQNKMNKLDDMNPYQSLGEAFNARRSGNIKQAEVFFKKTLKKAPYLNQAYMGLYHIYVKQQEMDKAQAMLIKALEWTYELDEKKLYKQKLYSISQMIAKNS